MSRIDRPSAFQIYSFGGYGVVSAFENFDLIEPNVEMYESIIEAVSVTSS